MITFDWKILSVTLGPEKEIQKVYWKLTATNTETKEVATAEQETALPPALRNAPFTPYPDVTKEQVIAWLKPLMDYDGYVVNLTARLTKPQSTSEVPHFDAPDESTIDSVSKTP